MDVNERGLKYGPNRLVPRQRLGFEPPNQPPEILKLQYPPPANLLSLIGMVSELKNQGIKVDSLAGGLPPSGPIEKVWNAHADNYLHMPPDVTAFEAEQYGSAWGNMRLRRWAAEEATKLTGKIISANEVLTTPGSQYALSAALLKYCTSGNTIGVTTKETYSAFLEAAERPLDIPIIGIESDEHGMIPLALEETADFLQKRGIKIGLVYLMIYGNPNGNVMPDLRGEQLTEVSNKIKAATLLDYAYHGITTDNEIPRITYFGQTDQDQILTFTGSKIYAPGERVAWLIASNHKAADELRAIKQAQLIMTPPRNEIDFWNYALSRLPENAPDIAQRYQEGIDAGMKAVIENSDIFQADYPKSGMFLWIRTLSEISTFLHSGEILHKNRIAYSPGIWFQPKQLELSDGTLIGTKPQDNFLRDCAVTEEPDTVYEKTSKLAEIFRNIAKRSGVALFERLPEVSIGNSVYPEVSS